MRFPLLEQFSRLWVNVMTRIRVELLIQPNEKETALHMFSSTINEKICWRFLESDVVFSCAVEEPKFYTGSKTDCNCTNKLCVSFEGVCECDVDIDKNSIENISIGQENLYFTRLRIINKIYHLEDYYEEEVKPNIVCTVLSTFLSNPKMDLMGGCVYVYLNDIFYKKELLINSNIQSNLIESGITFPDMQLTFRECWKWAVKNTSLFQKNNSSPVAFSTLSYILNRELHETLIYSTIGLESLFCPPKSKSTRYLLTKRIPTVFPVIEEDQIKEMYAARSDIVHGNIKIGTYYIIREIIKTDDAIANACVLGVALLVESIRKLIESDATHYVFEEFIECKCE